MTQKTLGQWTDRPKSYSEAVRDKAIEALLPQLMAWGDDDPYWDIESAKRDLAKVIQGVCRDGFSLAVELAGMGWFPDTELVEILDGVSDEFWNAHWDIVAEWVKANDIKPCFELGDRVKFIRDGERVGEIVRIIESQAQYVVYCKELGHKKHPRNGTAGSVLNYEDVSKVN